MDYQELLNSITPEIYENLKRAVELGKWPDGRALSQEQRETCMQAMIAFEHKNMSAEEHTGYVPPKPDSECGTPNMTEAADEEKPLNWQ